MTTIQAYQQQPYTLSSHLKFVFTHPLDFSNRLCAEKSGLDAGAKLYQAYYTAITVLSEKYQIVQSIFQTICRPLESVPIIKDLPLAKFAANVSNVSDIFINLVKCSNVPSKTKEMITPDSNGYYLWETNLTWKKVNTLFSTIVVYCDSYAFILKLAEAAKPTPMFKLGKSISFAIACISGAYKDTEEINNSATTINETSHKNKWVNLNAIDSTAALRTHYQTKVDNAAPEQALKVKKWKEKIALIDSNSLTLEQFKAKVAQKESFWENKKINIITSLKNDRKCQLLKLCSLIMDIALIILQEYGQKIVSTLILGYSIPLAAVVTAIYHLPAMIAVTNLVLSTLNMHKFSFDQYFGKKAR